MPRTVGPVGTGGGATGTQAASNAATVVAASNGGRTRVILDVMALKIAAILLFTESGLA